ncbi:hypothetical protein D3C78_1642190 [compost metagenome]
MGTCHRGMDLEAHDLPRIDVGLQAIQIARLVGIDRAVDRDPIPVGSHRREHLHRPDEGFDHADHRVVDAVTVHGLQKLLDPVLVEQAQELVEAQVGHLAV